MAETTRALALLAALVVALAPATNGVLEKAARTADRVLFEPADWDREPPEDPPDMEPPEDMPEGDQEFNGTPPGAAPSCEIVTEPVAVWDHQPPSGAENRTDPTTRPFEVNESHLGLGVQLTVINLTGSLEASVQHEDGSEEFSRSHPASLSQPEDINATSTIDGEDLREGEWEAHLDFTQATYDRLVYVVVRASCAEAEA